MKKFIVLSMIVFLMMSGMVQAAEVTIYTEGPLYYTIQDESITITGCFGKDEVITVPAAIAGYPVNVIGKNAFANNTYVKKVELPDTITEIQEGAFAPNIKVDYDSALINSGVQEGNGQQSVPEDGTTDGTQPRETGSSLPDGQAEPQGPVLPAQIDEAEGLIAIDEADALIIEEEERPAKAPKESPQNETGEAEASEAEESVAAAETDGASKIPVVGVTALVLVIAAVGYMAWKRMKK